MCRSEAEGGQRCHSHALNKLTTRQAALQAAREGGDSAEQIRRADRAEVNYRQALREYASTPEGQSVLTAAYQDAARRDGRRPAVGAPEGEYPQALYEGYRLRQQNALVKAGTHTREQARALPEGELDRAYATTKPAPHDPAVDAMLIRQARQKAGITGTDVASYAAASQTVKASMRASKTRTPAAAAATQPVKVRERRRSPMVTPRGDRVDPRPVNRFRKFSSEDEVLTAVDREHAKIDWSDKEAGRRAESALAADANEQLFRIRHGHYPARPFPRL